MTIEIAGRTRYADGPTTEISIRRKGYHEEPLLVIHGGLIEQRHDAGEFALGSKHLSATDNEHDSAYVTYLEGAGLTLDYMSAHGMTLNAVILKAKFYPEAPEPKDVGACDRPACQENPHGFLPFTPPTQDWKPALYEIDVRFVATKA